MAETEIESPPRIAVIPARGGSKRLPLKNIIDFHDKPIIAYTIEAALNSDLFKRIVVSTENRDIAMVAEKYGADVVQRPAELAQDNASVNEVCIGLIESEKKSGRTYDVICCLYATAPLRDSQDIAGVVELIKSEECNFAIAVTSYYYPAHQALKVMQNGELRPMWPDWVERRAQEVPPLFVDNGSTYAANVSAFLENRSFYGPGLKGYPMPRERSVDVDDVRDLELARFYARKYFGKAKK